MARIVTPKPPQPLGNINENYEMEQRQARHGRKRGASAVRDPDQQQADAIYTLTYYIQSQDPSNQGAGDEGMSAHDMSLRDQLLPLQHESASNAQQPHQAPHSHHSSQPPHPPHPSSTRTSQPHAPPPPQHLDYRSTANVNLDPAITAQYSLGAQPIAQGPPPDGQQYGILVPPGGGSASPGPPEDMDMGGMEDNTPGGRKRNRQLGGSKRAEQNRTAQRHFRQRKESYIKKLEDDVRSASALPALQEEYHRVQSENYHLRDYIMALQSRLLDLHGDYPPPPHDVELRDPRQFAHSTADQQQRNAPAASMRSEVLADPALSSAPPPEDAGDELRAAAVQADGQGSEYGDANAGVAGAEKGQEEASAAFQALRESAYPLPLSGMAKVERATQSELQAGIDGT